MSKYLTDRLNAVFIETSLTRKAALDTAEKAGLRRSDALAGAVYAAQQALRQQDDAELEAKRSAAQIATWGAFVVLGLAERTLADEPSPTNLRRWSRAAAVYAEAVDKLDEVRTDTARVVQIQPRPSQAAAYTEGTPEYLGRMVQRNRQVAAMKGYKYGGRA